MDTKHTPGPWRVGMRPGPMVYGLYGAQVADCRSPSAEGSEAGYNARLIAAAPLLLTMLRRLSDEIRMSERGMACVALLTLEQVDAALRSVEV